MNLPRFRLTDPDMRLHVAGSFLRVIGIVPENDFERPSLTATKLLKELRQKGSWVMRPNYPELSIYGRAKCKPSSSSDLRDLCRCWTGPDLAAPYGVSPSLRCYKAGNTYLTTDAMTSGQYEWIVLPSPVRLVIESKTRPAMLLSLFVATIADAPRTRCATLLYSGWFAPRGRQSSAWQKRQSWQSIPRGTWRNPPQLPSAVDR